MKATILILSFWTLLQYTNAQCIQNYNFAQTCGSTIERDNGTTFSDNCVPGWIPSHGTPQIMPNTPGSNSNLMYMWCIGTGGRTRGEGILAPYTFSQNLTYQVTIKYTANFNNSPPQNANPQINLIAAQDIRRPSRWKIGNLIPLTTRQQQIGTIVDRGTGWHISQTFVFTANNNYNQFWLYPSYTANSDQYNLYVDWVSVCPYDSCASDKFYGEGTVPIGDPKARQVFVGSIYGSRPDNWVIVSPTDITEVRAANSITLSNNFIAQEATGEFIARIYPCQTYNTRQIPDSELVGQLGDTVDVSQFPIEDAGTITTTFEDEYGIPEPATKRVILDLQTPNLISNLTIYPNPTQAILNIDLGSNDKKVSLRILNNSGMVIRNYKFVKGDISLGVNDLANGIYFIQIIDENGKITTRKFEKIK